MSEQGRSIFFGMQVLVDHGWVSGQAVVVENNSIKAIIPAEMIVHHLPAKRYEFQSDCFLIPGLIDLHIHGAQGKDVMDATPEALTTISEALAAEGVTGYLATTMTASNQQIEAVLKCVGDYQPERLGAKILGVHLEGPFISKMGAQRGADVQLPDPSRLHHWQTLARGAIKLVTLAPEVTGAMELIGALHKLNIVASIGHTNATYTETCAAINAGCTQATHLFNAMSGLHQREPGAVGAILLSEKVSAELIVDGVHLHRAVVELALRVKGKDKLLLVTDAMRAKCLGDGNYDLGGQEVKVQGGLATLADGTLAGSVLTMTQAIQNMAHFSHCSLADAVRMASYNPARVLGLLLHKGSIAVGKDADLVVLDAEMKVKLTMSLGREIYHPS